MWKNTLKSTLEDVRKTLPTHRSKRYVNEPVINPRFITVHHSGTSTGTAKSFASYHVSHNDWPGIGYHFVITRKGVIQWCHSLSVRSYHTGGRNTRNIGVCLVGNSQFTNQQMSTLHELLNVLCEYFNVSPTAVLGHNEHPNQYTQCPGLDMNQLRKRLFRQSDSPLPSTIRNGSKGSDVTLLQTKLINIGFELPRFGIDSIFGNETERAVKKFQTEHKLVVDGIVGPQTWGRLLEVSSK